MKVWSCHLLVHGRVKGGLRPNVLMTSAGEANFFAFETLVQSAGFHLKFMALNLFNFTFRHRNPLNYNKMSSSNTDSENSFEYTRTLMAVMSRSTTLHLKMVISMTRGFVGSHLARFTLTKSTHFLRRLIASGRESPKKGMVCTNMPLEGSATLLQLAATHLSGIFWTTFLLVSVHNHADQFPRWRHRPNSTHSPSNSAVNQRGAYVQNFKNSENRGKNV